MVFLLCIFSMVAQQPVSVTADSLTIAGKKFPAVKVNIPEANMEHLRKEWKSELESRTSSKAVEDNGLYTIFGAHGGKISNTPINIYSRVDGTDSLAAMTAAVELKKDEFAVPGSSAFGELEKTLRRFAYEQYKYKVTGDLDREEDKLRDLKKQYKEAKENKSDLNKDMKEAGQVIEEQNNQVSQLNGQIENLTTEINSENSQLASISDKATHDVKSKYIKDLEKKRKQLKGDLKSAEKRISKADKKAKQADKEIPVREEKADELKSKIDEQEEIVRHFKDKADAVKNLAGK